MQNLRRGVEKYGRDFRVRTARKDGLERRERDSLATVCVHALAPGGGVKPLGSQVLSAVRPARGR